MKLYQILSHDLARFFRTKEVTPLGRITHREVPGSVASVYLALMVGRGRPASRPRWRQAWKKLWNA